jgi:hypothetical protein
VVSQLIVPPCRVPVERVRRQPLPDVGCGYYSILNLYVWAGLEPPAVEVLYECFGKLFPGVPESTGLSPVHQFAILGEARFPLRMGLVVLGRGEDVRGVFTRLISDGCGLLFGYNFTYNGKVWGHSVVAESADDRGVTVLCSASPKYQDSVVQWHETGAEDGSPDADESPDPRPHGNKNIVPWLVQPYDGFIDGGAMSAVGIYRAFVIVWKGISGGGVS